MNPKNEVDQAARQKRLSEHNKKKKTKKKAINRHLAPMQIQNEMELDVEIGGEKKTVRIMMDTPDPMHRGMVQIAEDDLTEYWIYVQYEKERKLMKEIRELKEEL